VVLLEYSSQKRVYPKHIALIRQNQSLIEHCYCAIVSSKLEIWTGASLCDCTLAQEMCLLNACHHKVLKNNHMYPIDYPLKAAQNILRS